MNRESQTKVKKVKKDMRIENLKKTWYGKIFYFIWYDNSPLSWVANILLAFILIKFIFYPLISILFGTALPVVAVVSCSMEHGFTDCGVSKSMDLLCGTSGKGHVDYDTYWSYCGDYYDSKNISKERFKKFSLYSGFNKGDIIFLKGTSVKKIDVGDIIVFSSSNRPYPIIHRVISKELSDDESRYVIQTKGDHNQGQIKDGILNEYDVPASTILGEAFLRVPFLGYIKIYFVKLVSSFM